MPHVSGKALKPEEILELPVERWLCRIVNHTENGTNAVSGFIPESQAMAKRARYADFVANGCGALTVKAVANICIVLEVDVPGQVEGTIGVCTDPEAENWALMSIFARH